MVHTNSFLTMAPVFKQAMEDVLEHVDVGLERWGTGCSDMGDMASLMPTIHGYVGGATGTEHGSNYRIFDPETACVDSAKVQVRALRLLLENGAEKAREAVRQYQPAFQNKEAYFAYKESLARDFEAVTYTEDGQVMLKV